MRQGRASRDVGESRAVTHPSARAKLPGRVAQYGQMVGNHVTERDATNYRGLNSDLGRGYEPPKGPSQRSGVGGGRTIHRSGSQGRSE
jgi:hypothetical protein